LGAYFSSTKFKAKLSENQSFYRFFVFFHAFFFKENHVNPTVSKMYIVYTLFF